MGIPVRPLHCSNFLLTRPIEADGCPWAGGLHHNDGAHTNTGYVSHSAQALLKALGDAVVGGTSAPGGGPVSIHFRTLGDVAYFMTSLNTPPATIRAVEDRIWALLGR